LPLAPINIWPSNPRRQVGISRNAVIGISCGILVALFALQPFGTQRVAFLFR
jgi:K+ transporter